MAITPLRSRRTLHVQGATAPGRPERANEDRWGARGPLAWVIDGASQPAGTEGALSAADYARRLGEELSVRATWESAALPEILAAAIAAVGTADAPGPGPAATVAMLRSRGEELEWLVLGDAGCAVPDEMGQPRVIIDDRLARVAVAQRQARRRARREGAEPQVLAELSQRLYRAELAARNTAGGYWVAADLPEAAEYALTGIAEHGPALLFTDGMSAQVGPGARWVSWAQAWRDWRAHPPRQAVAEAQAAARSQSSSTVDDATLLLAS